MCSPNDKTPPKPELPQYDWDLDDPMRSIPTDIRPNAMPEDNLRCSACGQVASQDELTRFGGRHGHPIPAKDEQGNPVFHPVTKRQIYDYGCPPINEKTFQQRTYKHRTRKDVDRPPVRIILATKEGIKAPGL